MSKVKSFFGGCAPGVFRIVPISEGKKAQGITVPLPISAPASALGDVPAWTHTGIEAALRGKMVDELGVKPKFAFGPARVAVTGSRVSPPLFESMEVLGRESTLARLARLAERL